ncbi:MAG: hypothetical protein AABX51_08250 [Nanoarchaeota archaeon]
MNKRGEKELQMIFGLFILLIITLVILNIFLQTSKKGFGQVEKSSAAELKSQEVNRLKLNCQALCDGINDVNSAIEFCANYQSLDPDADKSKIAEKARYGKFEFCKTKVPCFLIIDSCQGGQFTMTSCKNLLLQDQATWDLYNKLVTDIGIIVQVSPSDGCDLPVAGTKFAVEDEARNWKIVGDYILDAAQTCDPANPLRPTSCP